MIASSVLWMASAVSRPFWRRRWIAPALPKGFQWGKPVLKLLTRNVNTGFRMPYAFLPFILSQIWVLPKQLQAYKLHIGKSKNACHTKIILNQKRGNNSEMTCHD